MTLKAPNCDRPVRLALALGLALVVGVSWGVPVVGPTAVQAQIVTADTPARGVPTSRGEIMLSFAPVVRKVAPAVTNIYSRKIERRRARSPLFDDPFFRHFFGKNFGSGGQIRERVRTSLGSGVIVDPLGLIVTNFHVVVGADKIRVVLSDRREFDAKIVLADKRTDLAVLKIDAKGELLPHLTINDSDALQVGDLVLAIGNPFGVGQTVTSGIVSALARTTVGVTDFSFFIQTDAAINPGNSGGALVTMDGGLVGINSAIYSRTGGSMGIGFAVPSAMVRAVLAGVSRGRVVRPWFGAVTQRVTAKLARSLGLDPPRGVLVNKVQADGPAAVGGLQVGDVITAINGLNVNDPEGLRFRIATLPVGGSARLDVLRRQRKLRLAVALSPPPEIPPRQETAITGANPLHGASVANLSPALADDISMAQDLTGVVIVKVESRSFAGRAGLRRRDIIRAVNGLKIVDVGGLVQILARFDGTGRWRLTLERKGQTMTLAIGG